MYYLDLKENNRGKFLKVCVDYLHVIPNKTPLGTHGKKEHMINIETDCNSTCPSRSFKLETYL